MTRQHLIQVLKHVSVPGMYDLDWDMDKENNGVCTLLNIANDIYALADEFRVLGLFREEDPIINSVRYGLCAALVDAVNTWREDDPEVDPCEFPQGFHDLWTACLTAYTPKGIPWRLFSAAYASLSLMPDVWWDYADAVLEGDGFIYYGFTVEHTITPVECGWQVETIMAGGWQDMVPFRKTYMVGEGMSAEDLDDLIHEIYPDYCLAFEEAQRGV